jgi:hypothetical protein
VLFRRWRTDLRSRLAGGGFKPPQAASVKSRGGERCGKGVLSGRQVRARKANASEPLMTCRKRSDGIKTEEESLPREQSGGNLLTAQVVPGMKVARAWSRLLSGTWEPAPPLAWPSGTSPCGAREGDLQAAETARSSVPTRRAGADCPVVVRKPGNAGGAKGAAYLGVLVGQL